jgi:hypothetical protein
MKLVGTQLANHVCLIANYRRWLEYASSSHETFIRVIYDLAMQAWLRRRSQMPDKVKCDIAGTYVAHYIKIS